MSLSPDMPDAGAPPAPLSPPTGRVVPGFALETFPRRPGCPAEGARIVSGQLRLGGAAIRRDPAGPRLWDLALSPAAMEDAQGMVWLDHLAALGGIGARQAAQTAVFSWIDRDESEGWPISGPARDPAVVGRRVMAWVQHASLLIQHRRKDDQRRFAPALERQLRLLAEAAPALPDGLDKAEALAGLLCGAAAVSAARFLLPESGEAMGRLAPHLIDVKGGCATRNPEGLLYRFELLLWSADALTVSGFTPAPAHLAALERAAPVLRALRHGDGHLARFHGGGAGAPGRLDRALSDCGRRDGALAHQPMGFHRLAAGRSILLADVSPPPATAAARAGCLGFDMSSGSRVLIAAPGEGERFGPAWGRAARATAAASAPGLAGLSLARIGGMGRLRAPALTVTHKGDDTRLTASHDGYRDEGLCLTRGLALSPDGTTLTGTDSFEPIPAAPEAEDTAAPPPHTAELRFHLGPEAAARLVGDHVEIRLGPPADVPPDLTDEITPEYWTLRASGAQDLRLEPSAWLDGCSDEPRAALQIVLSAPFTDEIVRFDWTLAKARVTPSA